MFNVLCLKRAWQYRAAKAISKRGFCSPQPGGKGFVPFIALDKLSWQFNRSSGPGGQNVNKVNTKAEVRFNVLEADWIPEEVRMRLIDQCSNRVNGEGELVLSSQEHRTQVGNKKECIIKLKDILTVAYMEPKEHIVSDKLDEKAKSIRKDERKHRSKIKQNRQRRDFD
jgi:peptidyl-tRNA hydrolase ICT1